MVDSDGVAEGRPTARTVGERLRDARVAQNLDLAEIGARTRIPQRHLGAIETSDFAMLPSITYAMGFAKAYARAVGVDEVEVGRDLRAELSTSYHRREPRPDPQPYDPARLPSRSVATVGVAIAALLLLVVAIWYGTGWLQGEPATESAATAASELGAVPTPAAQPATAPTPAAPVGAGQVTLTATDEVWVRIYDANDQTLLMKTMQPGERYDVPMTADRPMINIGRPDKLDVTINGSVVPPLGSGARAIKDVGIGAEALRARAAPAGPAPAATPAA